MTWQTGLILLCLAIIALYPLHMAIRWLAGRLIAEAMLGCHRTERGEWAHLASVERNRAARRHEADLIARHAWRGPTTTEDVK